MSAEDWDEDNSEWQESTDEQSLLSCIRVWYLGLNVKKLWNWNENGIQIGPERKKN